MHLSGPTRFQWTDELCWRRVRLSVGKRDLMALYLQGDVRPRGGVGNGQSTFLEHAVKGELDPSYLLGTGSLGEALKGYECSKKSWTDVWARCLFLNSSLDEI